MTDALISNLMEMLSSWYDDVRYYASAEKHYEDQQRECKQLKKYKQAKLAAFNAADSWSRKTEIQGRIRSVIGTLHKFGMSHTEIQKELIKY